MKIFTTEKPLASSWNLVGPSLRLLKDNIWPVLYLSFLPALLVSAAATMLVDGERFASGDRALYGILLLVIAGLWTLLTAPGFINAQVRAVLGDEPDVKASFVAGLKRLLPFIGMSLLGAFVIVGGLIVFIVPGLLFIRGFYLAPYYVVDKKLGPVAALKQSYQDSRPVTGFIWGTIAVGLLFSFVGGSLAPIPAIGHVLSLAAGYIYIFASALRYGEIARNTPVKLTVSK